MAERKWSSVRREIESTGDPFMDMLAVAWLSAFKMAERGDVQSRIDILDMFGLGSVALLYRDGCITWDPDAFLLGVSNV